jgi:CelD/BcsL family acetyltransferase involved in cellulose biosynthesis
MTPDMQLAGAPNAAPFVPEPPESSESGLSLELIHDSQWRPADLAGLHQLIEQRPHVGVFLSPAWLSGYFSTPPTTYRPCVALVREGSRLRGMAPLGIRDTTGQLRVTLLGGGGESDRTDLIAARGYEARCADALLAWFKSSVDPRDFVLELRDVPDDSPLWAAIHRFNATRHVVLQPREIHPAPYLEVADYRSNTAVRLAPLAKSLAKHRHWLEQRGHVRVDVLRDRGEVLAAFDVLIGFLHDRWAAAGRVSAFDDPVKQAFHRRVLPRLISDGLLRMVRVSVDLRTVAVIYALAAGTWWGCYQIGYDRAWSRKIHLGRLAFAFAMDLAAEEGALQFDFLKGAESVKYLWPVRERITVDADVFAGGGGAQLTRATRAARDIGVALVQSVRLLRGWR